MVAYKDIGRRLARQVTANLTARSLLRQGSQIGVLPGWVWKRLPVQTTFWMHLSSETGFQYTSIANDHIGRALYWRGLKTWEAETLGVFRRLVSRAKLFLDIGANTGVYTLLACAINPAIRVFAFEPVPHIYQCLCDNIRLNGWQDRCRARHEAVSSFVGTAQLHVPYGDLPTTASLQVEGFRGVAGELIEVPVTTIDAVCSKGESVDLVKIDVEGFEDKVLEGMQGVLSTSQPAIIVECLPDGPYREVQAILERFCYRFFRLHSNGPRAIKKIIPDDIMGRHRNYLCVPDYLLEWLK